VRIDTTSSELTFVLTGSGDRGRTVTDFANLYNADVAWNGDLFRPLGFVPEGFAFGGRGTAAPWPDTMDTASESLLYFIQTERTYTRFVQSPPGGGFAGWIGAISGRPTIVDGGIPQTGFDCNDLEVDPCNFQPRTAIGISRPLNDTPDQYVPPQYLYAAVVSGRSATSRGMRMEELGALMQEMGAWYAMALDGGSSSTLYIRNQMGVQNQLADGVERQVANHVGVQFNTAPVLYTIEGRVEDLNHVAVAGATVRRDDGQVTTTTSIGPGLDNYDFSNNPIPPRYVCISVHKTGYLTVPSACKQILPASGTISYLNVTLTPGTDPPDAAVPDAGRPDAAPPRPDGGLDAPVWRDGGTNSLVGDPGCSCQVGGTGAHGGTVLVLAALAALRKRRRR
jgi:MYXO-CTERM domain-containing protein